MNKKTNRKIYSIGTPNPLLYLQMMQRWLKLYELIQAIDYVDKESNPALYAEIEEIKKEIYIVMYSRISPRFKKRYLKNIYQGSISTFLASVAAGYFLYENKVRKAEKEIEETQLSELTEEIKEHFAYMTDPRKHNNKLDHKFIDIITIALCSTLAGGEGWEDMEEYGRGKEKFLRGFLELPNGIPSHDTFRRVFMLLDTQEWQECFMSWAMTKEEKGEGEIIALDGKCLRGSKDKSKGKAAIYMVSAWATERGMVLGQRKVSEKSNEITAIPELLKVLDISGCVITIDAMGCQRAIAEQIVEKGGQYVLSLKGNQRNLWREVEEVFAKGEVKIADEYERKEEGHGRVEKRVYKVVNDLEGLESNWPHLKSVVMVETVAIVGKKTRQSKRYYISSIEKAKAEEMAKRVRSHWGIENNLHWVLDIGFREDDNRIRSGRATENLGVLRHMALNLLNKENSKGKGMKAKRHAAGWDNSYMLKILSLLSNS